NRIRNSRDWFREHHEEYMMYVLTPLSGMVESLRETMKFLDPLLICEPRVGKSLSRIFRDTRFSRDKSIFRDHMWCVFMREKKIYHGNPGFFFEITPEGFDYGCGWYQADRKTMDRIREMVCKRDRLWSNADRAYRKQSVFAMTGDMYKRPPYPELTGRQRNWTDRRNLCFIHESDDFDRLFAEDLPSQIAEEFRLLKPVYRFLAEAEATK
ncbi:MAG: DUF2461 domain-containing protein, partial [Planctomycetia bacterium]|nr:DUF2461 domain-containing protein [Planctomycetia bacterium]